MTSRLAQFAERLIESAWLLAVIVVPLFFNVWSNRVFEPDKLVLLRSLAVVMVAAAAIAWWERGAPRPGREAIEAWLRKPLVAPVLLWTLAWIVSTVLSRTPGISFFGSYTRLQGLSTWLAYIVFFFALVALLRRRDQVERLVTALILTSLPIALYAVVQKFGLDPMPWLGDVTERIASTMGNSIFVAAYLIMVVPPTLARLIAAFKRLDQDDSQAAIFRLAGYIVLLVVQLLAIVLSQSRGPIVGLLAALFFLALLLAAQGGRRWLATLLALSVAFGAFVAVLNIPGGPLEGLRDEPFTARMGRVLETSRGTGRVRVLIWGGALELAASDPLRLVIGHGPESMQSVYPPFYPPELGNLESRNASPDRSHNELLDAVVQTGLIGLAAYMLVFWSVVLQGMRWLGLVGEGAGRGRLAAFWFGGGAVAAAASMAVSGGDGLLERMTFIGVAIPAGMVAGLTFWVVWRALRGWRPPDHPLWLLMAGLLAALIAHFVEIHFGIAIAATRTLFFAQAALLVALGHTALDQSALVAERGTAAAAGSPRTAGGAGSGGGAGRRRGMRRGPRPATDKPSTGPAVVAWRSAALTMLAILATLIFDYVVRGSYDLSADGGNDGSDLFVLVWLLSLAWVLGSMLLAAEVRTAHPDAPGRGGRYAAVTLGVGGAYGLLHWLVLSGGASSAGSTVSAMLYYLYLLTLAGLLVAWAGALLSAEPTPGKAISGRAAWIYPLVAIAAVVVIVRWNTELVRADILYKEGFAGYHANATQAVNAGERETADVYYAAAVRSYDAALAIDPDEDYFLLFKGKAQLERAENMAARIARDLQDEGIREGDSEYADARTRALAEQRDAMFEEAMRTLREAYRVAPLNSDHSANLARAYQIWGDRTFDPELRAERLDESRRWFAGDPDEGLPGAMGLSPRNAELVEQLATTELIAGDREVALDLLERALEIDPEYGRPLRVRASVHIELAEEAEAAGDEEAAEEHWAAAERDYTSFLESKGGRRSATGWSGLALVQARRGDIEGARESNERVLEIAPNDLDTLRNLAILERDAGELDAACAWVARGLQVHPTDGGLLQLDASLGCGAAPPLEPDE